MKAKIYSMLALAALLLTATGCSDNNAPDGNDPDGKNANKETLVTVRLGSGSATASRTEGAAATTDLAFGGGHMYFTSAQGIITHYYEISATALATDQAGGVLKLSDLTTDAGLELTGISANSDSIFIIGNVPTQLPDGNTLSVPTAVGGHIRAVQSLAIGAASQQKADGSTSNVTVYGGGKIVDLDTPVANKKKAGINVSPVSGRIEITKLTYTGTDITGYNVEAVYINNYYPQVYMDGYTAEVADSVDNGDVLANYVALVGGAGLDKDDETGAVSDAYAAAGLYDWYVGGTPIAADISKVAKLTDDKVWAYNVPAPMKSMAAGEAEADDPQFGRPHIIVRLNDIATSTGSTPYAKPMYLTMRLMDKSTSKEITKFLPGYVYQVEDIPFTDVNLYSRPEMQVIDVQVKVTLVEWVLQGTGVILN